MKINFRRKASELESVGVDVGEITKILMKDSVVRDAMGISFKMNLTDLRQEEGNFIMSGYSVGEIQIETSEGVILLPFVFSENESETPTWEIKR